VASAPLVHVCGESLRRICLADVVSEHADERRGEKDRRGGRGGVAEVFTDGNRRRKAHTPARNFCSPAVTFAEGKGRGERGDRGVLKVGS
jgi:hypothetical protein